MMGTFIKTFTVALKVYPLYSISWPVSFIMSSLSACYPPLLQWPANALAWSGRDPKFRWSEGAFQSAIQRQISAKFLFFVEPFQSEYHDFVFTLKFVFDINFYIQYQIQNSWDCSICHSLCNPKDNRLKELRSQADSDRQPWGRSCSDVFACVS